MGVFINVCIKSILKRSVLNDRVKASFIEAFSLYMLLPFISVLLMQISA